MIYHVTIAGRSVTVELDGTRVIVDGRVADVDLRHVAGEAVYGLVLDGVSHRYVASRGGAGRWDLHVGSGRFLADVVDDRTRAIRAMAGAAGVAKGPEPVVAPMPGMIVRVEVQEGDAVEAGAGVVIVEAMKMENELRAGGAGIVTRVYVQAGQAVEKGQPLVDIAPPESAAG